MFIENMQDYALECRFIVYRVLDGKKYFWGACDTLSEASAIAHEVNGYICERSEIDAC